MFTFLALLGNLFHIHDALITSGESRSCIRRRQSWHVEPLARVLDTCHSNEHRRKLSLYVIFQRCWVIFLCKTYNFKNLVCSLDCLRCCRARGGKQSYVLLKCSVAAPFTSNTSLSIPLPSYSVLCLPFIFLPNTLLLPCPHKALAYPISQPTLSPSSIPITQFPC